MSNRQDAMIRQEAWRSWRLPSSLLSGNPEDQYRHRSNPQHGKPEQGWSVVIEGESAQPRRGHEREVEAHRIEAHVFSAPAFRRDLGYIRGHRWKQDHLAERPHSDRER